MYKDNSGERVEIKYIKVAVIETPKSEKSDFIHAKTRVSQMKY